MSYRLHRGQLTKVRANNSGKTKAVCNNSYRRKTRREVEGKYFGIGVEARNTLNPNINENIT